MPKKIQKKTKVKGRVKAVTQTVNVYVGKRGGGSKAAPTQAPRPTALQQATQLVQAMRPQQQGESFIQALPLLQRLVEPVNARLEALIQQGRREPIPPNINIPVNIAPPNVNVPVNIQQQNEMMREFAQRLDEIQSRLPPRPREQVLDLPDAQLVQPTQPLIPAGPPRLDDPHEDVPLEELEEHVAEEKQEAARPITAYESLYNDINRMTAAGTKSKTKMLIRDLARVLGIQLGRDVTRKEEIVDLITREYINRPDSVLAALKQYVPPSQASSSSSK